MARGWLVIAGSIAAEEARCGLAKGLCSGSIDEKRRYLPENREVEMGIKRLARDQCPPAAEDGLQLELLRELAHFGRHERRLAKVGAASETEVERRRAMRLEGLSAGRAAVVEHIAVVDAGGDESEAPGPPEVGAAVGRKACWAELQARSPPVVRFDRRRQDPGLAAAGVVAGG